MDTTVLKNGLVYTPDRRFAPLEVSFSEGVITAVGTGLSGRVIDCDGCFVLPGLTDIHLHGCAGHDVSFSGPEALDAVAAYEFSRGVTAFCPTTMTLPEEKLLSALDSIRRYAAEKHPVRAEIVGIHLEGPFVSPEKCGAQDPAYIQKPSAAKLREWQKAAGGLIRLVTLAPECEGAADCIRECAGEFRFSLGHTTADYAAASEALAAGADHVTHLFNAMPGFHHRETGVIGAAFDAPGCFAELICDGVHISPTAVRAAFRLFGEWRTVLISDSMEAAGMPDGEYQLGGQKVVKRGPEACLADGTLAGSVTDLYGCFVTAVRMGIPPEIAAAAVTDNPCRSVGIQGKYGSIAPGKTAHFLILDKDTLEIRQVI
ncbi:N-acetylglucosamine-6-phosphate deacetylase [Ruminococcaceae bacterium FB2012]|nr:N-acetylglucosamine-6-phosphate deacetylase [Ruminococcaceae bacterium FB2012]